MPQPKARKQHSPPIHHRNRDATGMWVASFIMCLETKGEARANPRRRCLAWENTIILAANGREQAYEKALRVGRSEADGVWYKTADGGRARWVFEGLTDLLPVYDNLADGSELFYRAHHGRSVQTIKSLVKTKRTLSIFRNGPRDAV